MKKGFTLIELLAVIVVIAILSAVTVPIIATTIEKSNQQITLESVRELIKAASEDAVNNEYDLPYSYKIEDKTLSYQKGNFTRGLIVIISGNNSFVENLSTPKYCINGSLSDLKITKGQCSSSYKNYKGSNDIQELFTVQDSASTMSGLYFDDFKREYYFRGNVTNNYVKYAGITWRIVSFDNGSVKLITQGVESTVGTKTYQQALDYLNSTFYTNLTQKNYLKTTDYSTGYVSSIDAFDNVIAAEETNHTSYKVGLLTAGEYSRATLGSTNFLANGITWLMTRKNSTTGYYLSSSSINSQSLTSTFSVRPVIVLTEVAVYSGSGTSSDPYIVK